MCKHILNAQVSFQATCCKRWFDCAECHDEVSQHRIQSSLQMSFLCKKCNKPFQKDLSLFEEEDEFCPHCHNQFLIPAETGEKPAEA